MCYFKGGIPMPNFYRWLFFFSVLWNVGYLSGLLKIELQKKNYYGFVGLCLILGVVFVVLLVNFVNF